MNSDKRSWETPVGIWEVTTEGDCEGRSMRTLGIFKGHYCDIALGLADKCCYSLHFRKINEVDMLPPIRGQREKVQITFSDVSHFRDTELVEAVRDVATPLNISVGKGMWTGHVTLYRTVSEEERKKLALEKAKKVLSAEDLAALGLE